MRMNDGVEAIATWRGKVNQTCVLFEFRIYTKGNGDGRIRRGGGGRGGRGKGGRGGRGRGGVTDVRKSISI